MRVKLYPVPQSAGIARTFVRNRLLSLGFSGSVDDGCVIVSELVSNAIAAAPGEACFCYVHSNAGSPLLEVWDTCLAPPVPKDEGLDAVCGRGLVITAALAVDWGWHFPRPERGGGKVVWARLAGPADGKGGARDGR